MKHTIDNINFEYNGELVTGQVWIHDFYLDVYRKKANISTKEEFQSYCQRALDQIPDYFKEVIQ